ncbi:MAG TPA: M81 family metallopeptidase, partial [Thermomicrobiales bacterium]|nr:M81 family metallopeptidase [Thermomicrobiales bacterium]
MSSDITIAAAELSHETNTFSSVPTDLAAFQRSGLRRGSEIRPALRDSATSFAGFFDGAEKHGYLLVPIVAVWATPSGIVTTDALTTLVDDLVAAIAATRPDGVLLALHGAMVSEVDDDGDGWLLQRVRETVGADVPIVATLDLHANISQRMVDCADMLIGYDTYPHVDQRERASDASDLIVRLIRREIRPTAALVKPPMMPTSQRMTTDNEPMASIMALANEIEGRRGVLNVTVAGGFPPANTADTGLSVLVTTDNDPTLAAAAANELARFAWERRLQFLGGVASWEDAAEAIRGNPGGPLVLVDIGDNPWTGGPGDSVELLRFLLAQGVQISALALVKDPDAVGSCIEAGPGTTLTLTLGGKTDALHGNPIEVEA